MVDGQREAGERNLPRHHRLILVRTVRVFSLIVYLTRGQILLRPRHRYRITRVTLSARGCPRARPLGLRLRRREGLYLRSRKRSEPTRRSRRPHDLSTVVR